VDRSGLLARRWRTRGVGEDSVDDHRIGAIGDYPKSATAAFNFRQSDSFVD
jgi:hypothetical protein